ncbi:hypothetical protein [Burkholderia sp. AU45388]|uniref:hypothetical protein n=1 Tax=Burkholderia sp. AU45388 TaxID=3059206 RepID=UPI002656B810|nr:hypothetical protein [Burkholderia sp. AU45388]MDN7428860.1 hypothetical protein [Burkholderia sp. AU45388]
MPSDDDANVLEFFDERAAIMTFDGGLPRYDAYFRAMVRTRMYFEPRGIPMPSGSYFSSFWKSEFGWNDSTGTVVSFPCAVTHAYHVVGGAVRSRARRALLHVATASPGRS